MKVECINNNGCEGTLKVGQAYIVKAEFKEKFQIKLGNGVKGTYLKGRFKVAEE